MSSRVWLLSPLDTAERGLELLAPLAFDTSPFDGLPDAQLQLKALRDLLLHSDTAMAVRDAVWRELVVRARRDGPAWVTAAVGMALPGLRRMAGLLCAGWLGDSNDLDSELIVGFVARLRTVDVEVPRICGRLIDAGVRAARRCRDQFSDTWVVQSDWVGPQLPGLPWDHPDWVLARAVAAAVIDRDEAVLIGATRLGESTLAQVAASLGLEPSLAGVWRRKAELRLREAIHCGEVSGVVLRARFTGDRSAEARLNGVASLSPRPHMRTA